MTDPEVYPSRPDPDSTTESFGVSALGMSVLTGPVLLPPFPGERPPPDLGRTFPAGSGPFGVPLVTGPGLQEREEGGDGRGPRTKFGLQEHHTPVVWGGGLERLFDIPYPSVLTPSGLGVS